MLHTVRTGQSHGLTAGGEEGASCSTVGHPLLSARTPPSFIVVVLFWCGSLSLRGVRKIAYYAKL